MSETAKIIEELQEIGSSHFGPPANNKLFRDAADAIEALTEEKDKPDSNVEDMRPKLWEKRRRNLRGLP